jgi:hypothetical protein
VPEVLPWAQYGVTLKYNAVCNDSDGMCTSFPFLLTLVIAMSAQFHLVASAERSFALLDFHSLLG